MNLTLEDVIKIQLIDKITVDTLKELVSEDLVVDKLKGTEYTPGPMQELVTEVKKLRMDNHRLEREIYQLSDDIGKLLNILQRQAMSLTTDYDFQQIKFRRPA